MSILFRSIEVNTEKSGKRVQSGCFWGMVLGDKERVRQKSIVLVLFIL